MIPWEREKADTPVSSSLLKKKFLSPHFQGCKGSAERPITPGVTSWPSIYMRLWEAIFSCVFVLRQAMLNGQQTQVVSDGLEGRASR